jgi:ribosomal protein S18 acetylase RimI-like enzyme
MKLVFRQSNQKDIDNIYDLHIKCFSNGDQWYKSVIKNYLNNGLVVEYNNKIIGVLLQGSVIPCSISINDTLFKDDNYKPDIFEPINNYGELILKNNLQYNEYFGIVMICVDPIYRGKGIAKKLIEKHIQVNKNIPLCLHTRKSNTNAYQLYIKMGYIDIAYIKNKYIFPNEDSIFMVKNFENIIK